VTRPPEGPHPTEEPPAEMRVMARSLRGMYVALRQEGFSEFQACSILGTWLGTVGKGNQSS
jgi:hypothetical protein